MTEDEAWQFLTGQWIGDLRGSIVGNLYVVFKNEDKSITVDVRANSGGEVVVLRGQIDVSTSPPSAVLAVTPVAGSDAKNNEEDVAKRTTIQFDTATAQHISGRWENDGGDAGIFLLNPGQTTQGDNVAAHKPVEIVSRTQQLPKFRLYRSELIDIAIKMKEMIETPNDVVINARIEGIDTVMLARSFFERPNLPDELNTIRLSLSETKSFAPKSISIAFSNETPPSLTINSDDRVWVNGVFADLDKHMRRYYTWFIEKFQKNALSFNGIALLIAIGALPTLPSLLSRYLFLAIVIALMVGFKKFHDHINRVRIFPRRDRKKTKLLDMPEVISAAATAGIVALAGYLVSFFSGDGLSRLAAWFSQFISQ